MHYSSCLLSVIPLANLTTCNDLYSLIEQTLRMAARTRDVLVYDEEKGRRAQADLELAMALQHAIRHDMHGFSLRYQPIVSLKAGAWRGLEALCRWTRPDTGDRVPPDVFIPKVEQLGLISTLGDWVLRTAVTQCHELSLHTIDEFFLSVNVSPLQLLDPAYAERVLDMLRQADYPPTHLSLEVTESADLQLRHFAAEMLDTLCASGIRLALDDFGTGYSSFNRLKNMPVQFLKTEREFVADIERDQHLQYFFSIMAEIAHVNEMTLIAEGVETSAQLSLIRENGADYVQGYVFARPMTRDALSGRLDCFADGMLDTGSSAFVAG